MINATTHARPVIGLCLALVFSMIQVAVAQDAALDPELSISLRGVAENTIEVGEPLRVAVRVNTPDESTAKIELAPGTGTWIDATKVNILSASGAVVATARPAGGKAENKVTLDAEQVAVDIWWFPTATLTTLTPGDYAVRATLVIRDGSGWKGERVSETTRLRVVATSNDPERVTQHVLADAHAAVLENTPEKAAGILDGTLKNDPDNVSVLAMRAALSLRGGNPAAAQGCIHRALALATPLGGEPSVGLHQLASEIEAAANEAAPAAPVADWAKPAQELCAPVAIKTAEAAVQAKDETLEPIVPPAIEPTSMPNPPIDAAKAAVTPAPVTTVSTGTSGTLVPASELTEAKILADPAGQWAATAKAGSEYGTPNYSAAKMTGAPNVPVAGDSVEAWCHNSSAQGLEWVELTYAQPVHATEVRVRQTNAPGAIVKVEAIEPDGKTHIWWEGIDPYKAPAQRDLAWFAVRVSPTPYLVAKLKITLNLAAVAGWKEIDAVQLVGAAQ